MSVSALYSRKVITCGEIRAMWLQLAGWVKLFLLSSAEGLPCAEQAERRLLRACDDISAYMKKFYTYSEEFKKLLREYAGLAVEMMGCEGENADKLRERWLLAADELAGWCARVNPFWKRQKWQAALRDFATLIERAAKLCAAKDVKGYMECFDLLDGRALEAADLMSDGIVEHFNIMH